MEKEMGNANDRRAPVKAVSATLVSPPLLGSQFVIGSLVLFPCRVPATFAAKAPPRSVVWLSYLSNIFGRAA
jgi:hypothetical protein